MQSVIRLHRQARNILAAALLMAGAGSAAAQDKGLETPDWHLTSTFNAAYSSGNYGSPITTDVTVGMPGISLETGDFKFSASIPYMRISGRGLLVFDAAGNPILINRRTNLPPDVRTGWGDLYLSASYSIPPAILDDFEVRVTGLTKVPLRSVRRRLGTGETDFGMSVDVARQYGPWMPFVTVGYLDVGQPAGFTLYNTTSVSAGASLELTDHLVATGSYDFHSADSPQVSAGHALFGSLSWVRDDNFTLTGYTTAGLSTGSPDVGVGFVISYGLR